MGNGIKIGDLEICNNVGDDDLLLINQRGGTKSLRVGKIIRPLADDISKMSLTLADKVTKERGKGLSTNDFTNVEKTNNTNAINKATEALTKANNPLGTMLAAGYKVQPAECSEALLNLMNGNATINIGQGIKVNSGDDYPLQRVVQDGVLTASLLQSVQDSILDIKILNANPNKVYKVDWIGNGYANFGQNGKYGFRIFDYDKNTYASSSASSARRQQDYMDVDYDVPSGVVTRVINGKYDGVIFIITMDYDGFAGKTFLGTTLFGSAIIHPNNYLYTQLVPETIHKIKDQDYPFFKLDKSQAELHADMINAIIDVKIMNADPTKIYKIEWLGNGNTAWTKPEYAIYLSEYDPDNIALTKGKLIFDRHNAHLDAPDQDICTRIISADSTDIVLSVTLDYSKLRFDRYPMNSTGGAGRGHIVDQTCYYSSKPKAITDGGGNSEDTNIDLAVFYQGAQDIKVKMPYGDGINCVLTFGKLGINEITHFTEVYHCIEDKMTTDFSNIALKYPISSDWLSPYGIKAINNPPFSGAFTVGGNHGTQNGLGFATARSISTDVYVDGRKVEIGETIGAKECIEIHTVNHIFASNTIDTANGGGRDSVKETVLYKIYKDNMYVNVCLEAIEDVHVNRYCGFQMTAPPLSMQDKLYMMTEDRYTEYVVTDYTGQEINSCAKSQGELDRFIYHGKDNCVVCYKDVTVGIGDGKMIDPTDNPIYKSTLTKVYMHNMGRRTVNNHKLVKGDTLYWSGGYVFTAKGLECEGAKKAYTIREKDKRVYVIDFEKATTLTWLKTYIEDRCRSIKVISKSSTVTCDNYITSQGLKVSSTGYGQLKFIIE